MELEVEFLVGGKVSVSLRWGFREEEVEPLFNGRILGQRRSLE